MQRKSALKSHKINFWALVICGNITLKPTWYPMENLSDIKKYDSLGRSRNPFQKRYWRQGINFAIET